MMSLTTEALQIGHAGITPADLDALNIPAKLHKSYLVEIAHIDQVLAAEGVHKLRWGTFLMLDKNQTPITFPYDGNVYIHSLIMTGLAELLLVNDKITLFEKALLKLAARFHDLGELKHGDKIYNLKTTNDDIAEQTAITHLLTVKLELTYIPTLLPQLFSIIFPKSNNENTLAFLFHLLEKFGYLNTCIQLAVDKVSNWQLACGNTFTNQFPFLLSHLNQPSVQTFFSAITPALQTLLISQPELWSLESYLTSLEKVYNTKNHANILAIEQSKGRHINETTCRATFNTLARAMQIS